MLCEKEMSNIVRRVAKRFLENQRYQLQAKECWWWSWEIQKALMRNKHIQIMKVSLQIMRLTTFTSYKMKPNLQCRTR